LEVSAQSVFYYPGTNLDLTHYLDSGAVGTETSSSCNIR